MDRLTKHWNDNYVATKLDYDFVVDLPPKQFASFEEIIRKLAHYEDMEEIFKWTPCEERLPEHTDEYNVTVYVASEFGCFIKVTTLRFENIQGKEPRWIMPKNEIYNVIAWAPLPHRYVEQ